MQYYSEDFKQAAVAKMAVPGGRSATSLSEELGVSQSSLSRWLRERGTLAVNGEHVKQRRPEDWTAEEKVTAVLDFEKLSEEQRGTFLREKGVHEATLVRWKAEIVEGMKLKPFAQGKKDPQQKRIAALERELRRKDAALAEAAALLVLKKSGRDLGGGKGREIALEDRQKCRELIEEAVGSGARLFKACEVMGISVRTYQRWGKDRARGDGRHGPRGDPANRLSEEERQQIVTIATSEAHRDVAPSQIVPMLAEGGIYVASESSFNRV